MPLFGLRSLKFREDPDLSFLKYCDNHDLEVLKDILVDEKGDRFRSEELTHQKRYKECGGDFNEIWDLIGAELQTFGADGIWNVWRGVGVPYREILIDVCKLNKVKYNKDETITEIELKLLEKVIADSLEKMTPEQLKAFVNEIGLDVSRLAPTAIMAGLQVLIRSSGFAAYKVSVIVANAAANLIIGRGLTLATNAALARSVAVFAGPIGWAVSLLLAIPILTGPAYRITIPACIVTGYMRQKYINKDHF